MTRLKSMGSNLHRLGLLARLIILAAELWFLFYLFQDGGHPVSKALVIGLIVLTLFALFYYYDRPVKNFNRMVHGLEYREGTFKLRHGSRTLGTETQKYLNRLNTAFTKVLMDRERQALFFENILKINPSGILVISQEKKIKLYNDSFVRILGIRQPLTYGILDQRYPELANIITTFDNGRQIVLKLKIKGVSTWISITGSGLKLEGEDYQVIALEDVQKVANKKELETWEEMAKIIIHEVKNSLSPIRLLIKQLPVWFQKKAENTQSGQEDRDSETRLLKTLESIEKRTLGLMEFVEGYKALLHLPQPKKKKISLANLIKESIRFMSPEAQQKRINLSVNCPDDISFEADYQQIMQVLMNLIGNSMHFLKDTEDPTITISGTVRDSEVSISVEDNGPGIPVELHEQVFTPFFSTREGGTGIGLSFAKKVIGQHQGNLNLMSMQGKTVFTIHLPFYPDKGSFTENSLLL